MNKSEGKVSQCPRADKFKEKRNDVPPPHLIEGSYGRVSFPIGGVAVVADGVGPVGVLQISSFR